MLTWIMSLKLLDGLEAQREGEAKLAGKKFEPAVLDPASGTGGFLVEAFNPLGRQVKTVPGRNILQEESLLGCQPKPLPYLLCQMNLLFLQLTKRKLRRVPSGVAAGFQPAVEGGILPPGHPGGSSSAKPAGRDARPHRNQDGCRYARVAAWWFPTTP
jgi:N-6 DNA Methylase